MLIHKHRDFPSDMFTIMCAVGATIMIGKIENGSLYLRNRKQYPCFYTCSYRNTRVQKFGRTGNNQRETIQYGEFFLFILWVLLNYLKCFCHRWLSWGVVHLLWGTNYVYSNDDWTVEYFDVHILDREQSLRGKEGLPTTHQETKYALPAQRKIPIGQNQYACQSNLICTNYAINNSQTACWFYN
jgi:hypothetical protein